MLSAGGSGERTASASTGTPEGEPPGNRRVAVLLGSRPEDAERRWDPASTARTMFSATRSVDAYFRALSFGRISMSGDVYGWYDTPNIEKSPCEYGYRSDQMWEAAKAAGFDPTQYDHVMLMWPHDPACTFSGRGQMPGRYTWINGNHNLRVLAHELGHNLGIHHAGSLGCTDAGAPVALGGTCKTTEYGDTYSLMGNSQTGFANNWHRAQLHLVPSPRRAMATRDGVFDLSEINADDDRTKLLQVPRAGGGEWLSLELRQRPLAPFEDAFNASGVLARVTPPITWREVSSLIDTTPGSPGGQGDADLKPGGPPLVDPQSRTQIHVESVEGGVARVRVGFLPSVPKALAAEPRSGEARLSWEPSTDETGVDGYLIERDGQVVGESSDTVFLDEAPGGKHGYRVIATDAAGNEAASEGVTVEVPPAPPKPAKPADPAPASTPAQPSPPSAEPPRVPSPPAGAPRSGTATSTSRRLVLVSPRRGRLVPKSRRVRVRLTGQGGGASRVALFLDGRRITGRRSGGVVTVTLPGRAVRGRHVLQLRASGAPSLTLVIKSGRVARG